MASGKATIAVMAATGGDLEGEIGSVRINVDDLYQKLEKVAPYTLFGDRRIGDAAGGLDLGEGEHTLQIEVFKGKKAISKLLGDFTLGFEVSAALEPAPDAGAGVIGIEDLLIELWDANLDLAVATLGDGAVPGADGLHHPLHGP